MAEKPNDLPLYSDIYPTYDLHKYMPKCNKDTDLVKKTSKKYLKICLLLLLVLIVFLVIVIFYQKISFKTKQNMERACPDHYKNLQKCPFIENLNKNLNEEIIFEESYFQCKEIQDCKIPDFVELTKSNNLSNKDLTVYTFFDIQSLIDLLECLYFDSFLPFKKNYTHTNTLSNNDYFILSVFSIKSYNLEILKSPKIISQASEYLVKNAILGGKVAIIYQFDSNLSAELLTILNKCIELNLKEFFRFLTKQEAISLFTELKCYRLHNFSSDFNAIFEPAIPFSSQILIVGGSEETRENFKRYFESCNYSQSYFYYDLWAEELSRLCIINESNNIDFSKINLNHNVSEALNIKHVTNVEYTINYSKISFGCQKMDKTINSPQSHVETMILDILRERPFSKFPFRPEKLVFNKSFIKRSSENIVLVKDFYLSYNLTGFCYQNISNYLTPCQKVFVDYMNEIERNSIDTYTLDSNDFLCFELGKYQFLKNIKNDNFCPYPSMIFDLKNSSSVFIKPYFASQRNIKEGERYVIGYENAEIKAVSL